MRNYYICMLQESQPMRIAIMDDDAVFIDIQFCIRRFGTSSTLQKRIRLFDCYYNSITRTIYIYIYMKVSKISYFVVNLYF